MGEIYLQAILGALSEKENINPIPAFSDVLVILLVRFG
jgi:hypothetical protein